MNPETGEALYRMSDVMTGYYDSMDPLINAGTLTVLDGVLQQHEDDLGIKDFNKNAGPLGNQRSSCLVVE